MADGHIKNVEDVIVGDFLMGENGFREVLELRRGYETMYRIIPTRGDSFVVNESHILALHTWKRKYIKGSYKKNKTGKQKCRYEWFSCNENISVKDFLKKSKSYQERSKLRKAGVKEFMSADIDNKFILKPYHLGLFLGDGSMEKTPAIHNRHNSIFKSVIEIADQFKIGIKKRKKDSTNTISYFFTNGNAGGKTNLLAAEFSKFNLRVHCRNKFIPHMYKTASYNDRLELLAGLIDTDGHLSKGNVYDYISASVKLANDIAFVCRSVGLCVTKNTKIIKGVIYYKLCISGNINKIPCRRTKRQAKTRLQKKDSLVTGFKIEKLDIDKYYGFILDGDHLYLTDDFIVHHNTGKTCTALEIYRHHKVKTLVICPLSLIEGAWFEEIYNRYPDIEASNLWAAKKRSPVAFNKALEKEMCIINYESFRTIDKKLASAGFEMAIIDESARIRTWKKNSTADKVINFCDNVKYVYELSGVPAPNNMLEYWTQIRILDPLLWGKSFYKFRIKYFNPGGYGGYTWKVKPEYEKKLIEDIKTVA
ncbi:MAG: hypothetical protein J7K15_16555, partial [Deltaproteobacteria bacterium]|nr:hypothetical protein [Deltaproteobacteria bacterium]